MKTEMQTPTKTAPKTVAFSVSQLKSKAWRASQVEVVGAAEAVVVSGVAARSGVASTASGSDDADEAVTVMGEAVLLAAAVVVLTQTKEDAGADAMIDDVPDSLHSACAEVVARPTKMPLALSVGMGGMGRCILRVDAWSYLEVAEGDVGMSTEYTRSLRSYLIK